MIFDTHSHCYWDTLEPRIDDIIANMQASWVVKSTQIGCDIESSLQAIALARRFSWVLYATVGHHPETAQDIEITDMRLQIWDFEKLVQENRDIIVAIGETGFDHHYLDGCDGGQIPFDPDHPSERAKIQIQNQERWWLAQWDLAKRYDLPLVIHTRDARAETLIFMKEHNIDRCVMHCFSEDWEFARELLEFSTEIYFSFSGILTYKNTPKIQEAASKIPLDRILIETDSPFLAPQAVRGTVNEPSNTRYVLDKLCDLRSESREEIERVVYENSLRFYSLQS